MTFRQALDDYTNALVVAIHGGGQSPELLDKRVEKLKRKLLRAYGSLGEQTDTRRDVRSRIRRVEGLLNKLRRELT